MAVTLEEVRLVLRAETDRALQKWKQTGRTVKTESRGMQDAIGKLNRALGILGVTIGGAVIVQGLVRFADSATRLRNQLRLVTDSTGNLNEVQKQLVAISLETRTAIETNATLFARLTRATKELGLGQTEVLQLTENLAKAVASSGVSAQEAENALIQLSQGLASGALRGDEFNSVAEQMSTLLPFLAKELGVTTGELRKVAAEGRITADVVSNALLKATEELDATFAKTSPTISGGVTNITTAFTDLVGALNDLTGASSSITSTLNAIARGVRALADAVRDFDAIARSTPGLAGLYGGIASVVGPAQAERSIEAARETVRTGLRNPRPRRTGPDVAAWRAALEGTSGQIGTTGGPRPSSSGSGLPAAIAEVEEGAARANVQFERMVDRLNDVQLAILDAGEIISQSFSAPLAEAIRGVRSFSDALSQAINNASQRALTQGIDQVLGLAIGAIAGAFTSQPSGSAVSSAAGVGGGAAAIFGGSPVRGYAANGAIGGAGGVRFFASGGGSMSGRVFSGATAFGLPGGGVGVLGEAGDEAVMPLERTRDGKLGVASNGGAGVTIFNISGVQDARDTRRSLRHERIDEQRTLQRRR